RYRRWIHLVIWLLLTAYYIAALVLNTHEYLIISFLYVFISGKILFYHVPLRWVSEPLGWAIRRGIQEPVLRIPTRVRHILGVAIPLACYLIAVFVPPPSAYGTRLQRAQSCGGMVLIIGALVLTSKNRSHINWRTVLVGLFAQFLIALFTLKTSVGYALFHWLAQTASGLLSFASYGTEFLFGKEIAGTANFAMHVLPVVLFFASFIQIVYYLGGMQWFIRKFAFAMVRLMGTSGAESVVAVSSFIVGQCESALLVKPFIEFMTLSELHSVMVSGFATISGSVLAGFISLGVDPQALITACVMSMPCSLVIAKLRYPETEESLTSGEVNVPPEEDKEANVLHAAANGAAQGLTLAGLIGATLLAVISLLALVNTLLTYFGSLVNIKDLTLELITSYLFIPLAWCMGVPNQDLQSVGQLLATKMFASEFVAYNTFTTQLKEHMTVRSQLLTTYALCGFANFASIGIQIGGIGAISPNRKSDLAKVAMSAMLCGTISTLMTACIAGVL
ncbi:Na+ dependent nucleoside transporter C-terminus-domain-containing protein, partial [Dimargaris cristalligena]